MNIETGEINISALMSEMTKTKAQIKTLKAKQEELRTNILLDLKTNDLESYEDEDFRAVITKQSRRNFNKDAAIDCLVEHGENTDRFFEESDYEQLNVKAKRTKSEDE